MKKLLLFLMTILSCQFMSAQELTKEEVEEYVSDSLASYEKVQEYAVNDCGQVPIITKNATVRYEKFAEVYLEFKEGNIREQRLQLVGQEGDKRELRLEGNSILIQELPLDQSYVITAMNNCEEEIGIATFSTTVNNQDIIKVSSRELFDAVVGWANNKENKTEGLSRYVLSLEGINRNEKLAFLQDFYFNDDSYPTDIDDERIVSSVREGSKGKGNGECNCKTLELNTGAIATPGSANHPTGPFSEGGVIDDKGDFGKRSSWWYKTAFKGPSKKIIFSGEQAGLNGDVESSRILDKSVNGSPMVAEILYALICEGGNEEPGDCKCSKTVEVGFRYDTKLGTLAKKGQCDLCVKKRAFAKAEDWAGVVTEDTNGVKVADMNGALWVGQCDFEVNKNFLISSAAIIGAIAANIATAGGASTLIPVLQPLVKDVLSTDIFNANACSDGEKTVTLLNGKTTLALTPGKIAKASMFTFDAVTIGGKNGFHAQARINSDFFLATVLKGGKGGEMESCCSSLKADWLSASMGGPLNDSEVKAHLNQFLVPHSVKASGNVGEYISDYTKYCGKIDGIKINK